MKKIWAKENWLGLSMAAACLGAAWWVGRTDPYFEMGSDSFSADLYKGRPCPHEWQEDKVKDWGDGVFTIYVSCKNCGTKSWIEGHADTQSESHFSPNSPYSAESFATDYTKPLSTFQWYWELHYVQRFIDKITWSMLPEHLHDELDVSQDIMQDVVKDSLKAESFEADYGKIVGSHGERCDDCGGVIPNLEDGPYDVSILCDCDWNNAETFNADVVGEIDSEGRVIFCHDEGYGGCEEDYCHRCSPVEGCTTHEKCQEEGRFEADSFAGRWNDGSLRLLEDEEADADTVIQFFIRKNDTDSYDVLLNDAQITDERLKPMKDSMGDSYWIIGKIRRSGTMWEMTVPVLSENTITWKNDPHHPEGHGMIGSYRETLYGAVNSIMWWFREQDGGLDFYNWVKVSWDAETFNAPNEELVVKKDVTPKGSKVTVEECVDIQATKADAGPNYYRVRFREPAEFDNFRVPAWAARAANTMGSKYYDVAGSKVTMGQLKAAGAWKIQSVLIPNKSSVNVKLALKIANHIQDRLEKEGKWASKECKDNERVLIVR